MGSTRHTCVGYCVYVDGVYILTEGQGGTPDGYCAFSVTEGTHTLEIRKNGRSASKTINFVCGTSYTWVSMPDNWCGDGGGQCDNPPTVSFDKSQYYEGDTVQATVSTIHSSVHYEIKDCSNTIRKSGSASNGASISYTIPAGTSECCYWTICFYWDEYDPPMEPYGAGGNVTADSYQCTQCYDFYVCLECPDADGDEVCDADDNCPNVPGHAWNCGCPCATGGDADVVFIMDTSSSMDDDFSTLCSKISTTISDLQSQGITVTYKIVGITENRDCTSDYVTNMVTNPISDQYEDWGPATQDIAEKYSWRVGATKIIIPMSDECPENGGNPCNDPGDDRDAITNACAACQEHNVMASPVMCSGQSQCGDTLGQALATCSHGTVFRSTDPASDLVNGIKAIIGGGTCDRDGDSVPDGCDPWPDDPCRCGDQDGDGVDDCACVLYLMEGDVSMDGHVKMVDVMFIAQYKAGLRNLNTSQLQCADTTDDGDVKMVDAMHIAQWKADPDGTLGVLYKPLWESQADADMRKPEE